MSGKLGANGPMESIGLPGQFAQPVGVELLAGKAQQIHPPAIVGANYYTTGLQLGGGIGEVGGSERGTIVANHQ